MPNISILRSMNRLSQIALTAHSQQRLVERGISVNDIVKCIETGEIIAQYEDDKPFPSCLILGSSLTRKPLHIVVSNDSEFIYLITAYYPSPERWEADFKTRKGC